jgi:hypothetical protein
MNDDWQPDGARANRRVVPYSTITTPCMNGCGSQKYSKRPTSVNFQEYVIPGERYPELHWPPDAWDVCASMAGGSQFTQVTVVPAATCSVSGLKE